MDQIQFILGIAEFVNDALEMFKRIVVIPSGSDPGDRIIGICKHKSII